MRLAAYKSSPPSTLKLLHDQVRSLPTFSQPSVLKPESPFTKCSPLSPSFSPRRFSPCYLRSPHHRSLVVHHTFVIQGSSTPLHPFQGHFNASTLTPLLYLAGVRHLPIKLLYFCALVYRHSLSRLGGPLSAPSADKRSVVAPHAFPMIPSTSTQSTPTCRTTFSV